MTDTSADWVGRATGRTLTQEQRRCVEVLCTIARPYNLQLIGDRWDGAIDYSIDNERGDNSLEPRVLAPVEFAPTWMLARLTGSWATHDGDELTRLVLAAHRKSVRFCVYAERYLQVDPEGEWPSCPAACLTVQLNARVPAEPGSTLHPWERHPTIDQLVARASIVGCGIYLPKETTP